MPYIFSGVWCFDYPKPVSWGYFCLLAYLANVVSLPLAVRLGHGISPKCPIVSLCLSLVAPRQVSWTDNEGVGVRKLRGTLSGCK
jgi:hypothetical protein